MSMDIPNDLTKMVMDELKSGEYIVSYKFKEFPYGGGNDKSWHAVSKIDGVELVRATQRQEAAKSTPATYHHELFIMGRKVFYGYDVVHRYEYLSQAAEKAYAKLPENIKVVFGWLKQNDSSSIDNARALLVARQKLRNRGK